MKYEGLEAWKNVMKEKQETLEHNAWGHVRHETRDTQQQVEYKTRRAWEHLWHAI